MYSATELWTAAITSNNVPEYCFIILNQNIDTEHFIKLWFGSKVRVVADGGTDRLLEWLSKENRSSEEFRPDAVVGDMDSISAKARDWIKRLVSQIHLQDKLCCRKAKAATLR